MPQVDQNPPLRRNWDGSFRSAYPSGNYPEYVDGGVYEINGTGFGVKSGYADHIDNSGIYNLPDGSNFGVMGRWSGENFLGATNRPTVYTDGVMGKCLRFIQDVFGAPGRSPNNVLLFRYDNPVGLNQVIFVSQYVNHDAGASSGGGQWKMHRWQNVENSITDKSDEIYVSTTEPPYAPPLPTTVAHIRDFDDGTGGPTPSSNGTNVPNNRNVWQRVDFRITLPTSYSDHDSFKFEAWFYDPDGLSSPIHCDYTDNQAVEHINPYKQQSSLPTIDVFQNFFGNGDYGSSIHTLMMANMFESVGDDWRVEYCDNEDYTQRIKSYIQPPPLTGSHWTDTKIRYVLNRKDISNGWLHVIKNGVSIRAEQI